MLGAGWHLVVAVSGSGIVVGPLRGAALLAESDRPVEEAMEPGPGAIRADFALDDITRRLRERGVPTYW